MDGSRRISLRNRKFLRKYQPIHIQEKLPAVEPASLTIDDNPAMDEPVNHEDKTHSPAPHSSVLDETASPHKEILRAQVSMYEPSAHETEDLPQLAPAPAPPPPCQGRSPVTPTTTDWTPPSQTLHAPPTSQSPFTPAPHPDTRRSQRSNRGVTNKYSGFHTGDEYEELLKDEASSIQGINAISEAYPKNTGMLSPPMIVGKIVGHDGYLMAAKLPEIYRDKSAWWTVNGWAWIQH